MSDLSFARSSSLPLHPNRERIWDGPAAASRMLDAATDDKGKINRATASLGFTYVLGNGENRGDYKSPFADLIGGRLQVVFKGVTAAISRNGQVKGITDSQRASGLRFLERQRARFDEKKEKKMSSYPTQIQLEAKERKGNKVVALSGRVTRNQDWFSGKHFRFIPSGIRLEDYQRNPILLWSHNASTLRGVLGTAVVTHENDKLMAEPTFHGQTDESKLAKKLWDMGVLNAVSVRVGFSPDDMLKFVEGEREIVITSGELQELSIVTVPADPGAVREAALSLGIQPERATQILMEVNMDEDTLQEGIEMGDDSGGPVFSPEDEVALAVALTNNAEAFHVMRDAIMAEVRLEYEDRLMALQSEVAELRGEPVRRQMATNGARRSMFSTTGPAVQQAVTPPDTIRQPQRNGKPPADPKRNVAAAMMAKRR